MANIITSQEYINDEIVNAKIAANDFVVTLSPVFTIDGLGGEFQIILDGHHSLEAAKRCGAEPEFEIAGRECDLLTYLDRGDVIGFLEAATIDGDYRYADDGILVF